ncbi:hypothetical protein HDV04_001192 [Boothiomyces sp. JEL0838]|nr:hypothetical protein HDV04_001192 [Boothiomyces sp. JEL0838]
MITQLPTELFLYVGKYLSTTDFSNLLVTCGTVYGKAKTALPFLYQQEQLVYHLVNGNLDQFSKILNKIQDSDIVQEILCLAATIGQIDIINLIESSNPVDYESIFLLACESNQLALVQHLQDKVESVIEGINICVINGYLDIFITTSKNVDLSFDDNLFIRTACLYGYPELVAFLLNDERVDPAAIQNESLKNACKYGYLEIVKLLVQDERVDPLVENNIALQLATLNNHQDIVDYLVDVTKTFTGV